MADLLHLVEFKILPFLVVIGIVVFVHEFGHYWVARRCGVRVLNFSIGFGREIFGWTDNHGTRWKVSWLPLGGYVKMFGDADPASSPDEAVHHMTESEKKVAFFHQSVPKRLAIVAAGPLTNYLFAIVVMAILFATHGQPFTPANVGSVDPKGPAAAAGMKTGDHVVAIDGAPINRFEDIKQIVTMNEGTAMVFSVERDDQPMELRVQPEVVTTTNRLGGEQKNGRIGIGSGEAEYKKWPAPQALWHASVETWNITAMSLKAVGQMIIGTRGTEELGGPLRIAELSGKVAEDGIVPLIQLVAFISISLGMINLFPIPLLDGGHLVFYALEGLKGSPVSQRLQDFGMRVGIVIIASVMIFATWNDLVRLKVVSSIRSLFS